MAQRQQLADSFLKTVRQPAPSARGQSGSKPKRPTKAAKETEKLYAKQSSRRLKSGLLPDPLLGISDNDYTSFVSHLKSSNRVIALLGAGLSAPSGIATFRGSGSTWRGMDITDLASPEMWAKDPGLVWLFYAWRRHKAINTVPNRGHIALAKLAKRMSAAGEEVLMVVNQNIDGLSARAGHLADMGRVDVHGSLCDFKCEEIPCGFVRMNDYSKVLCPALDIACYEEAGTDLSDKDVKLPVIPRESLPRCPECQSLLRPRIIWFGEPLNQSDVGRIHGWLDHGKVDLMLVVGTSAVVFPAANYIYTARKTGARIAYFNTEKTWDDNDVYTNFREGIDWWFQGSAADILPEVLKEVVGKVPAWKGEGRHK